MNETRYKEISCKSALNKINSRFLPYNYDLNIYRGCSHKCKYCYAIYSQKYVENQNTDFYNDIYIKTNVVENLEKELRKKSWKQEAINLGGVTDSYQKIEEKYMLTRDVLKLCIKYKTPVIISTKSNVILRDLDLIDELARVAGISTSVTITTVDEKLASSLESGASTVEERFEILKQLKSTRAFVGLHNMPIIPYLTDSEENLEEIYKRASKINIDYAICGLLNLRGETKKMFLNYLKQELPYVYNKILETYNGGFCNKEYKINKYKQINELTSKYKISRNYMRVINEIKKKQYIGEQLDLFNKN